jgi:hypothetical protein
MKQLFIHIGLHKTGTTAIQKFLRINRPALLSAGYLYPGRPWSHAHHAIGWMCNGAQLIRRNVVQKSEELCDEINNSRCTNVIISTEALSAGKTIIAPVLEDYLQQKLRDPWTAKIIVYLRRQDRWLESRYMENIRRGLKVDLNNFGEYSFQEFFHRHKEFYEIDYVTKLKPWSEVFGKENIIVRVYEKGQWNGSIVEDFLHAAGIHNQKNFAAPPKEFVNRGLSEQAIELLRIYNKYIKNSGRGREFLIRNILSRFFAKPPHSAYTYLSPRERYALLIEYEESNRQVAKEYLGRADGRLFYEEWPDLQENE